MKEQEKVDGGESQVGLLLFGQATSTEPYSAECRHNPMPIKLVEASTPQPCLITPSDLHWFAACSEHFEELNEQLRHFLMFVMNRQNPIAACHPQRRTAALASGGSNDPVLKSCSDLRLLQTYPSAPARHRRCRCQFLFLPFPGSHSARQRQCYTQL